MVIKGKNPLKRVQLERRDVQVTITTTVYIPELNGYWEQSLDVLKVCLGSLIKNTPQPYDLVVFDNNSCEDVRTYLLGLSNDSHITSLILSNTNIGKAAAVNRMFAAAETEFIVYTDCDVLFHPGWLEESLRVMTTFDRVGIVSGRPWRPMGESDEAIWRVNAELAEKGTGITVERGDLIPRHVLDEHSKSIGLPVPEIRPDAFEDMKITKNGVSAFTFGSHFQYTTRKSVIRDVGPLGVGESGLSKAERLWDENITAQKYLRLTLEKPLVYHIGNTLYEEDSEVLRKLSEQSVQTPIDPQARPHDVLAGIFACLMKVKVFKRILLRVQQSLFEALSFRS